LQEQLYDALMHHVTNYARKPINDYHAPHCKFTFFFSMASWERCEFKIKPRKHDTHTLKLSTYRDRNRILNVFMWLECVLPSFP